MSLKFATVFSILTAFIGLCVLVSSIPLALEWSTLYSRGVAVRAKILETKEHGEVDAEVDRTDYTTEIAYQFEADVTGKRRVFRRGGRLPGRYRVVTGFIRV